MRILVEALRGRKVELEMAGIVLIITEQENPEDLGTSEPRVVLPEDVFAQKNRLASVATQSLWLIFGPRAQRKLVVTHLCRVVCEIERRHRTYSLSLLLHSSRGRLFQLLPEPFRVGSRLTRQMRHHLAFP